MTTENIQTDKSKLSSTHADSPGQMRGWFKLIETIRKTDPPSASSPNSHTNGHASNSPQTTPIDNSQSKSPNLISSSPIIHLPTTPTQSFNDIPTIPPESPSPPPKPTDSKRRSVRHKKITIRKSTKSKELSTINPPVDDDIILTDLYHPRKRQSIDSFTNIPLATDLQSLPGHDQDEIRDQRFIDYSDLNTLSIHLNKCLYIDKKSSSLSNLNRKQIFKTRHNILNKIFKLYYIKTFQKYEKNSENLFLNKKFDNKTNSILSSSNTFKMDWSVNRRNSSSYKHEPKNLFHILQLNPKNQLSLSTNDLPSSSMNLSIEKQYEIHHENMKDLLIRTYYPHFHMAFKHGYYFGSKSKIPIKDHQLPRADNFELLTDIDQSMTITLKSPPSVNQSESKKRGRRSKYRTTDDKPLPITSIKRRVSEEIPPVNIASPPVIEKEINDGNNNNRKRKVSITMNTNINERKKKKSIPSPELLNDSQDISYSDSDDDILPDELPKQNFVKNGLRSNYYKSITDITDSKSLINKNRSVRRHRQLSGSLPPFYTGLFESEDKNLAYINYQLPYDIYWFSQKQVSTPTKIPKPSIKKKKSVEPKQKPDISYKNFSRNTHTDSSTPSKSNRPFNTMKMEDLTSEEKQIVKQSSILLKRNLQRIKEKRQLKDKINHQQKQNHDEQTLPLIFPQNYYHSNSINQLNSPELSHKDLLSLFLNHIRRSYFAKTGLCSTELIDPTCYYAQLGQLTYILNEIFDCLLNYKCQSSDIYPSNALKKCPLKRLFPMYYEIITKPIDLTIIRAKLDNGDYLSYQSFEQDLLLLFNNAITYCGENSDVGQAVNELENYFLHRLKSEYQSTIDLFNNFNDDTSKSHEKTLNIFTNFIKNLHEKEIVYGQIRQVLSDIMYNIDLDNPSMIINRLVKPSYIIHCRCGSYYDDIPLVQCYSCHLWQHQSCVTITDVSKPYYCFECDPLCEQNPLDCLKTNIKISIPNQSSSSYSTITRSDGLMIRTNECYFVKKQEAENSLSKEYDIFSIENIWIDENHIGHASGFYYLRPYETFHEANRKFFPNEIFRFPSTNDSIDINDIIRPCYVLDPTTYSKGKPIPEYTSRIGFNDLFLCEYRVDKLARTFTRLPKAKHLLINTKSYCFDNYVEKLSIKRDYQSHQKESHQTSRRRSSTHPIRLTAKQFEEKSSRIDGVIEKIYCHFHHPNLIPTETKFSSDQFYQQPTVNENLNRGSKRLRDKNTSSTASINKKRRTRSISSNNDHHSEWISDNNQHIISLLLDELIESISSHIF